jgi:hypothetical protein
MKIIDIINHILESGTDARPLLDTFLNGIAEKYPDLAPVITEYLAQTDAAVPPSAETLLSELKEVLATHKLNPRNHPSDLAG